MIVTLCGARPNDCEKREDCPIARYVPEAKCEALTATGIKIVQEWMEV